jgi:hypothetical protein
MRNRTIEKCWVEMAPFWQCWLYHTPGEESRFTVAEIAWRNSLRRPPTPEEKLAHAHYESTGRVPEHLHLTEDVIWTKKWATYAQTDGERHIQAGRAA